MSREIKFRAFNKQTNKMMYETDIDFIGWGMENEEVVRRLHFENGDIKIGLFIGERMQYTGLKDKTGKEIYEGDIIDASYINPMSNEVVKKHYLIEYGEGQYKAKLIGSSPYGDTWINFINEKGTVIANTYENPELLESEE